MSNIMSGYSNEYLLQCSLVSSYTRGPTAHCPCGEAWHLAPDARALDALALSIQFRRTGCPMCGREPAPELTTDLGFVQHPGHRRLEWKKFVWQMFTLEGEQFGAYRLPPGWRGLSAKAVKSAMNYNDFLEKKGVAISKSNAGDNNDKLLE